MPKKIERKIYDDLRQSLSDAIAYERGQVVDLRATRLPSRPKPTTPEENPTQKRWY